MRLREKNYKWIILITCILVYSSANLVRLNYTGIASYLMTEWQIGKPELGVLGAAFFYAYALGQSSWGSLTDLFGGRKIIPCGVFITAILMGVFAITDNYHQAVVVRALLGFVGGASFVPCVAVIGHWFGKKQRGLAMNLFSGPGGGLGEVWSFLLLPIMALFLNQGVTVFGMSSWHAATFIMGIIILVIAIVAYGLLRSDPTELYTDQTDTQITKENKSVHQKNSYKTIIFSALKNPSFWIFVLIWQGFTVCLRLIPSWLPLYAATFYQEMANMSKAEAMIAGGAIASFYVAGRIIGPPFVGKLSDWLLSKYNISRIVILIASFSITLICSFFLTLHITSAVILVVIAFILGTGINLLSILNTVITETWSVETSGTLNGVANTITQFIGAASLSYSGYMAVNFAIKDGGFNLEYRGIWFLVMISVIIAVLASIFAFFYNKKREKMQKMIY